VNSKREFQTKNFFQKFRGLFSSRPRKFKKAVIFAVLTLAIFISLAGISFATVNWTNQQKTTMTSPPYNMSSDQVSDLEEKNVSYTNFVANVSQWVSKGHSQEGAATYFYNDYMQNGTGLDVATGNAKMDEQVGISAAVRGLGEGIFATAMQAMVGVLSVLAYFLKWLIYYAAQTLDLTLNPNLYNFANSAMVVQGWTVVRDVCNLFFLLVLLFIAICTILKIEKYHAKKNLLMLIIMALLINFSKPIAVFIFDGSQLLMNFFLSQMGEYGTGKSTSSVIAKSSHIAEIVYNSLPSALTITGTNTASFQVATQYLFVVVFLFMLGVAFVVTALFLIIRIVAIMMLIIVSPFAFFAAIVPDFSKMSSKWWSSLFEYSYYGPAAAFFLLLATNLSSALPKVTEIKQNDVNIGASITNIVHYLVVLVFLYASIFMAKQFGGGVGGAIVGNANRFMKWGAGMGKGGGFWGGAARVTGAASVFSGIKGGIAQRPGLKYFTKEGREASRKETEEKWKERVAPFNIATARKKSEERKNDSDASIEADAQRGDPAAILQAMNRGGGIAERLMTNNVVLQALDQYDDLRNTSYKSMRDNGQHHLQVANEARRNIGGAPGTAGYINGAAMNTITEGVFRNASPTQLFSDPNMRNIVQQERDRGGDYLTTRMANLSDRPTLERIRGNVKNPETMRVLDNLIDWHTHNTIAPTGPTPIQIAMLNRQLLS
jgi:hypothetical protein